VKALGNEKKHGGLIVISDDLINQWLEEKLKMKSLKVHHITTEHYQHGVAISFTCDDKRLPIIKEGERFTEVLPVYESDEKGNVELIRIDVLDRG
jgi:hypothetical protein